jgi:hypothetical protein
MRLLIYAPLANASSKHLVSVITTLAAKENIEIFHTPENLARRLSHPNNHQASGYQAYSHLTQQR